jgi:hypothetical protein
MKNINDVIADKQIELDKLRKELYILKEAARMMMEPVDVQTDTTIQTGTSDNPKPVMPEVPVVKSWP